MAGGIPGAFDFQALALRIVRTPGFSTDWRDLDGAFRQWQKALDDRLRAEAYKGFVMRYLREVAQEDRMKLRLIAPSPAPMPTTPVIVPPAVIDAPAPAATDTGSKVVLSTESDDYGRQEPPAGDLAGLGYLVPAEPPADVPAARPVSVPPPAPAAAPPSAQAPSAPAPKAVQQDSRKVAAYRKMYPALTELVALRVGYTKAAGKCSPADSASHRDMLLANARVREATITNRNGRIEDRLRLVTRDRILNAKDEQEIASLRAEAGRWDRITEAQRAHDGCLVEQLEPGELEVLGFQRTAA